MRIARTLLLALGFVAAPLGSGFAEEPAPSVSSEQTELARRYVGIGGAEELFFRGVMVGFEGALTRNGITLTADQRTEMEPILRQAFTRPAQIFTDELTAYFATHAEVEDLRAAVAYYESDTGQRYADAAVEVVLALAAYATSGGQTSMPGVISDSAMTETQRALSARMIAAFGARLGTLEREQLRTAGLDPDVFVQMMANYFVGRLEVTDLEAAVQWAETPHSRRLEGASAERNAAEQVAGLRALQAFDTEQAAEQIAAILRRSPT
jgi:hypothetical protein